MKQLLFFVIIFLVGAASYALLNSFFEKQSQEVVEISDTQEITQEKTIPTTTTEKEIKETENESPEAQEENGALLEGPFTLVNADGEKTKGTVRIIRSPEETLLQFENAETDYALTSHIYLASDLSASKYLNLGPAKLHEEILVYGMPLDADLSQYSYILVFDAQLDEVEYYAALK